MTAGRAGLEVGVEPGRRDGQVVRPVTLMLLGDGCGDGGSPVFHLRPAEAWELAVRLLEAAHRARVGPGVETRSVMAESRVDVSGPEQRGERDLEVVLRVVDRGPEPEWHRDRALFAPWCRFRAELSSYSVASELGHTPWEAVHRLVANHRVLLERRWSVEREAR